MKLGCGGWVSEVHRYNELTAGVLCIITFIMFKSTIRINNDAQTTYMLDAQTYK